MKVGELKEFIKNLPDDMDVCISYIDKYIDMETHRDVEKIFVDDYYNWLEIKSE